MRATVPLGSGSEATVSDIGGRSNKVRLLEAEEAVQKVLDQIGTLEEQVLENYRRMVETAEKLQDELDSLRAGIRDVFQRFVSG